MIKFIRRHEKKVMAFMGVLLMLMFIKGLVPNAQTTNTTDRAVATLDGTKISQAQLNSADEEWKFLKTLSFVDPNRPNDQPRLLVVQILTAPLANEIEQSQRSDRGAPLFFLLRQEARREEIGISSEELQTFVNSYVQPLPPAGTDERDRLDGAVADCLMIGKMMQSDQRVVKISRPYQRLILTRTQQDVSAKIVPIPASSFLGDVPAPTEADIRNQFDQYSDQIAADPNAPGPSQFGRSSDPLGFGYKVPNRVQVQYIGLNHSDVHDAAVASKSKEDWYIAAYGEFKANRDDYDSRPLPPATQPAQGLGPTTHPSSAETSEPAPRKLDNLDDDFALHAPLVLDDLYDRETQTMQDAILRQINDKLNSGFGSYRDAIAGGAAIDPNSPAAQYTSFKFIQDLADSIHSQYGVTPIVGNVQQFKTAQQLSQIEGIGKSLCNQEVDFPEYATQLFQPWLNDQLKNSQLASLAIVQWQPSNPLQDEQDNVFIFRISGSQAAHAPALADVRDQVIQDWKISAAYDKAVEAGHILFSAAQAQGLDAAAASSAKGSSPIVTEMFSPQEILSGNSPPTISPLNLRPDSVRELADAAQQLLTTPPGHNGRPQLLAELYPDRIVSVIELHKAKPAWDSQDESLLTMEIMRQLRQAEALPLTAQAHAPQAVADRLNYHAVAESKSAAQ